MNKKIILSLILVSFFSFSALFAQGTKEVVENQNLVSIDQNIEIEDDQVFGASAAQANDSLTLENMLKYALEDERLALAEYEFIISEFNVSRPFSNIINAEKSHEKAVLNLYDVYGFEIEDFDATTHLIIPNTLEEIYNVGVEAEIANIAMYDKFLTYDLPDDVRRVFESLKKGSISHLEAFERQASKYN